MKKLRVFIACLACRAIKAALHLLGRGGTAIPGKVALKICPDLLSVLGKNVDSVVVTGTNGKSTTVGMLRHMLEAAGIPYLSNRTGANLTGGITAEYILNADLFGRPKARTAVIECDEGNFPAVTKALQPKALVLTNLFRDQLDRYGDIGHTRDYLKRGVEASPSSVVCLNADCALSGSIGAETENPHIYFGVECVSSDRPFDPAEGFDCPECGVTFEYSRHVYAHLGDWVCPSCGKRRHKPDMAVTAFEPFEGGSRITLDTPDGELSFVLALPALYNAYNSIAALSAAGAMGWDVTACAESLAKFGAVFGRMETLQVGDVPVQIILVKNPAGFDRALEYLAVCSDERFPILGLNDNTGDGKDISWINDVHMEAHFAAHHYERIGVFGTRADDLAERLKAAGVPESSIVNFRNIDELAGAVQSSAVPVSILPNYTAMLSVRDKVSALAGGGKFWQ